MSTATVHQINVSSRSAMAVVAACFAAIALSIILPFVLQSTKTVLVHTTVPAASTSVPTSQSPDLLRASHGG